MLKNFALLGVGTGQEKGLVSHLLTSLFNKSNVTGNNKIIRVLKNVKSLSLISSWSLRAQWPWHGSVCYLKNTLVAVLLYFDFKTKFSQPV